MNFDSEGDCDSDGRPFGLVEGGLWAAGAIDAVPFGADAFRFSVKAFSPLSFPVHLAGPPSPSALNDLVVVSSTPRPGVKERGGRRLRAPLGGE